MAKFKFEGVGIRALSACVPSKISRNEDALRGVVPDDEIRKTIFAVGIAEKRIAPADVCASDLCARAAEQLFADNPEISRESIDALVFMSQTGDFRIPATAPILQRRLALPQTCAAFDVSLGCSGYVFALAVAFSLAANVGARRVLLLDGETFSKIVNPRDRVNAPLYGDAGTATLVEKIPSAGNAFFVLNTDGSGEDAMKIPVGNCRAPTTAESLVEATAPDGSVRAPTQIFMDGMDVFNFALRRVPAVLKEIAAFAGTTIAGADAVVFHQANKMMTDFFAKRMKLSPAQVPYSLGKYGNTSSASVPLTISECLSGNAVRGNVILCGFGAGLSWGAAQLSLADAKISPVAEF